MSRLFMAVLALVAAPVAVAQVSAPASTTARPPLPLEVFAELPQIERPRISPNGKRIVARLARDGQMFLAVIAVDGGVAPTYIHPGKVDLNWWRWVNDDWIVVGVGREQNVEGTNFYVRRAIGIQTSTGQMVPIADKDAAQRGDDIVWAARDGSARVMLAYQTSIYIDRPGFWSKVEEVDLATGKRRLVQGPREGVLDWYADRDGVIRMGIGSSLDGRSSRLLYRESADAPVRTVDRAKRGKDRLTVPSLFLRDKNKALVIEDDEQGYSALYEYDLATLQRGKQLFATPGYDVGGVIANINGDGFAGVYVEENRPMIRWIDPEMAAMHTAIAGQVKGGQVEISSLSRDGQAAVVNVGGADSPGAWLVFRNDTRVLSPLAFDNRTIGLKRMHPVRTIRYKARDGLEIAAVLTLPRGKTGKLPLIVMPHGGPSVRDSEVWDWWAQFLADRGYAVVQPNYRGSTGYGTKFQDKGEGQWGLAMQDDLDDAIKALADQGIADPKRVCMVGASYGGYAALRAAQRDGDKYRCAVSYAGVSDLNRMLRHQRGFLFAEARGDWLRAQAPDLKDVSPVNFPAAFSIPVLLMHGEEDRVVPIIQSRVMAQKLKSAGKDVTYIVQPLADHHFTRQEDRVEFLKALEAFLAKHNPA
ncbi:S9 family peptidase [Sphingomonas sp. R647]|uniref:alpha/beta hydrolase family protein n=1 Tax=Sphingomonas sp. R647 TaxID=2875233 RepID=UPI001CD4B1B8|nr:S9 family peptidase [Sphingomonas sp. R647]MCA1199279.1 S9 family peptidase [Sphingomonas sp. R647]